MSDSGFKGLLASFIDGSAYQPQIPTSIQAASTAASSGLSPLAAALTDPITGQSIPVPPNASVRQNMLAAKANSPDPFWFYNQVNDKGPWDYKLLTPDKRYQDFGNFNYGATGTAFGWPQQILDRMAGVKQMLDGN